MLLAFISWIILGLIVGFVVSKLVNLHGDDPGIGIAIGAVAAVAGGWLYSALSGTEISGLNFWSLLIAAIAAVIALTGWHAMRRRSASRA